MEIQDAAQYLIFTHAALGGIALMAGLSSIISKKGSIIHKKSGIIFFYSMLVSVAMAFVISILPQHESPFLFSIAVFSSYFILTGYRALRFKRGNMILTVDRIISFVMLFTGISMIFYSIVLLKSINIVLLVFGIIGLIFASRDLFLFQHPENVRKDWLKLHLGKMIGGYIAATTAFIVVNELIPSYFGWFIPGIIGGIYSSYWIRKLNKKTAVNTP